MTNQQQQHRRWRQRKKTRFFNFAFFRCFTFASTPTTIRLLVVGLTVTYVYSHWKWIRFGCRCCIVNQLNEGESNTNEKWNRIHSSHSSKLKRKRKELQLVQCWIDMQTIRTDAKWSFFFSSLLSTRQITVCSKQRIAQFFKTKIPFHSDEEGKKGPRTFYCVSILSASLRVQRSNGRKIRIPFA